MAGLASNGKKNSAITEIGDSPLVAATDAVAATQSLSINTGSGRTAATETAPTVPRDFKWTKPQVASQAREGAIPQGGGQKAVVTYVGDGDGATLNVDGSGNLNCRIDMIDAPETAKPRYGKSGQPFGAESRQILQDMILNKEVSVRVVQPAVKGKNFDRAMCQIEVEGSDVGLAMVQQGAAWLYWEFSQNKNLAKAQGIAERNRMGMWNPTDAEGEPSNVRPQYPPQFRQELARQLRNSRNR